MIAGHLYVFEDSEKFAQTTLAHTALAYNEETHITPHHRVENNSRKISK